MKMRKHLLLLMLQLFVSTTFGLNVTIIQSSTVTGHIMDTNWNDVATGMGHSSVIVPQTTLDNTIFFSTTDILIVASGTIALPPNRVNTIIQFLQTGKPVYLQGEYLPTYTTNIAFEDIISSLGGSFSWGSTFSGHLIPMNAVGSFGTNMNTVSPLSYYWYGVNGSGDCNTLNMLEYNGFYFGFQYISPIPSYGTIISSSDQDWIRSNNSPELMENIITHLISPQNPNGFVVNSMSDTAICQGASFTLNATTSGATYLWQDNSTDPTFEVTEEGTYWVTVTVNNCSATDTIHVDTLSPQILDLGNDTAICQGDELTLDVNQNNGTYLWQDNSTDSTFEVTEEGTYWVTVTFNICNVTDTIHVDVFSPSILDLGNDTAICMGDQLTLDATQNNGIYLWQDSSMNPTYNVTQSGDYFVTVTNAQCGFTSTDTISVVYTPLPSLNLGNDTVLCEGDTLVLLAGSFFSYEWQDNSTDSIYQVEQQGIYWVRVTENNCSSYDSISVDFNPLPIVNLGSDTTLCEGDSLLLNAFVSGAGYVWSDMSIDPDIVVTEANTYWVIVSLNNCFGSDSVDIEYMDLPEIDLGEDTAICEGDYLILNVAHPNSYCIWQDGSTGSTMNISESGNYWVSVVVDGCEAVDSINVLFERCEAIIEMPNIFSPNGDGDNEIFQPVNIHNVAEAQLLIYNRWGTLLYEGNYPEIVWDGTFNTKPVSEGTYFWVLTYKSNAGVKNYMKGSLQLIR